ncbi:DUF1833 domain-containing protein, partial [Pseudomonas aeruginosa]|uniref:DUF1833 family protein n=1 Tax=Pseudomonas aeruginosa TaxID=287 RepID=UPI002364304D
VSGSAWNHCPDARGVGVRVSVESAAEAIDAGEPVTLVLRIYLGSDLTAPAERPYRMRVKGVDFESLTVQVEAGYYDLINTAALRHIYNVSEFPGLKYWP